VRAVRGDVSRTNPGAGAGGVLRETDPLEDYPWAPSYEERMAEIAETERTWGSTERIEKLAPSKVDDEPFQQWTGRYWRQSSRPKAAAALLRMNSMIDVRPVLPSIRVPTLLLYRRDDADVRVEEGRYIASQIPGAKLVELPGTDHFMWAGEVHALLDEVEEFLTGVRRGPDPDRVLATVLFTDVVGSTGVAARLGDRAWRDLLGRHHGLIRRELQRWREREIDTAGDGFLAMFDGPARAIRCAAAVAEAVRGLDLEIRAATPARSRWSATRSAGSPCTSARGSPRSPSPVRCWSRERSRTSSSVRGSR
jgi:Adenylate and Guanylate cyclase catalytic domain